MREYIVQMLMGNGTWVRGRRPNMSSARKTFDTKEEAQEFMRKAEEAWTEYIEKYNKISRLSPEYTPVEWRILSREVGKWEEER